MIGTERQWNVRLADWQHDNALLSKIRREVFIIEQCVPEDEEWEEQDQHCIHALATDENDKPIGTARLLASGKIGRMAVAKEWRKHGVGSALISLLLQTAKTSNHPTPFLDAQMHAIKFYEKFGFIAEGGIFDDAGIPHRRMCLKTS